ncbi:GIY-YIG nuclease family protein [Trichocoleus sp. FACHB-262]|nr:GIY-YIG nuclease family protein [Trichocoleus sp. FACHB-262]
MLRPSEIDVAALPSVALNERSLSLNIAGIYFAIASDNSIQCIGKSVNLQLRWQQHHRFKQLQSKGPIKLAWLDCPIEFWMALKLP